ncbi:MAG: hypothetical protein QOJ63_263 [Solirubrobacteraceae bacterium]|jgi:hypothetical protein|nr:hypothetical protein [Solirubrobacteraceae bacterium]
MKTSTTAPTTDPASFERSPSDRLRLRAGYHLYRGPDGCWRLAGPDDAFHRVHVAADVGEALRRICSDEVTCAAARDEVDDPSALTGAIEALEQQGCLMPAHRASDPQPRNGCVAVAGTGVVAEHFSRLMRDCGVRVIVLAHDPTADHDAVHDVAQADLLVACADWLPDSRWLALDELARARGIPWHRVHCEGPRWYLGPLTIGNRTASYRDTRARRLAAADHPAELACAWAVLDSCEHRPPMDPAEPSVAAVLAGLLAADALAVLAGRTAPSEDHQVELDASTFVVRRHPVLPLPYEVLDAEGRE